MPRQIDETSLTKGELRKLNALRKSLGRKIADKAFGEWLEAHGPAEDPTAQILADVIAQAVEDHKLHFPRGGYLVRRGRGRVIVETA